MREGAGGHVCVRVRANKAAPRDGSNSPAYVIGPSQTLQVEGHHGKGHSAATGSPVDGCRAPVMWVRKEVTVPQGGWTTPGTHDVHAEPAAHADADQRSLVAGANGEQATVDSCYAARQAGRQRSPRNRAPCMLEQDVGGIRESNALRHGERSHSSHPVSGRIGGLGQPPHEGEERWRLADEQPRVRQERQRAGGRPGRVGRPDD